MTSTWDNFFVAVASSAAALTGLLFVAVSINLSRILSFATLPGRAAEALIVMFGALAVALCGLVPQGHVAVGVEWVAIGTIVILTATSIQLRARALRNAEERPLWRALTAQGPAAPFVIGGLFAVAGSDHGPYWVVIGSLLSLAGGVFDAWVLLVEIQR